MPPLQMDYTDRMRHALLGGIANTEPNNLISRTVEGEEPLQFGRAVMQADGDRAVVAADTGGVFRGITVRDQSTLNSQFEVGDEALVMTRGVVWVMAGGAVEAGEPAFVTVATGMFAATGFAIPNAIFETSAAADELVAVRLYG